MVLNIEDREFNTENIKRLYPAGLVKTGYRDETTEVSLEWLDVEAKGKVDIIGYAIFIILTNKEKYKFFYKDMEELNIAMGLLSAQLKR